MDVKELLEDKNIDHVKRGRDYIIRCLNPDHEDNNPSLRVDMISGMFGCFSCGFSGNLYDYFNITNNQYLDIKVMNIKEKISNLVWSKPLQVPLDGVKFTAEYRNIRGDTLKHFGAFTTDSLDMEGRIVFPITDILGNIKSFNGRYLHSDLEPRYKFHPHNSSPPLYPSKPTQINNSIILVEGLFDMINLYDKGLTNAVCTFGTAFGFVKKKLKIARNIDKLLQYKYQGVNNIDIMYDGDESGRKSAENLKNYIGNTFTVRIIDLEEGKDPGNMTVNEVNYWRNELYG